MKKMILKSALKVKKFAKLAYVAICGFLATVQYSAMTVCASGTATGFDSVTVSNTSTADAGAMMGKIIGLLLTVTRYVGIGLIVFGIYEVVMSFIQQQPEAKTKGIVMALAGLIMAALKSVLVWMGVVS